MLYNLTPHPISIHLPSGEVIHLGTWANVARVEVVVKGRGGFNERLPGVGEVFIPVKGNTYGKVTGLPEWDGTNEKKYVVSRLVAEAAQKENPERGDLYVPGELVRDSEGKVVGCKGLSVVD